MRSADPVTGNADSGVRVLCRRHFPLEGGVSEPCLWDTCLGALTGFGGVSLGALFTANDGDFLTAPSPKQTANNGKSVSG